MYAATRAAGSCCATMPSTWASRPPTARGRTGLATGLLSLDEALAELRDAGKGVLSDVKEAGILDEVLAVVARSGVTDEDLWLNGRLDVLGEDGVRAIRATHPGATVQCPIDFIAPSRSPCPTRPSGCCGR